MIRIYIPGFYNNDSGGPRWGDCQLIDDGTNYEIIDCYLGIGKTRFIKYLKDHGIKKPYLYISHAHGDHDEGIYDIIKDSYFTPKCLYCYDPESLSDGLSNNDVRGDYNYLKKIIQAAKDRKIPVKYLKHGDHIIHGDIDFYVYRKQPKFTGNSKDPNGWSFCNDGSLCFWFPKLKYWTSGDGPEKIYDMCKSVGANPVLFKIPHHGNNCNKGQADGMKSLGAKFCWDNDYSTNITEFLRYGRNRCIEAGIKYLDIHGDINILAYCGKVVIYKHGKVYKYACSYNGKATLKYATITVIEDAIAGKYGSDDARTTALINAGYWPSNVQNHINKLYKLIKG